MRMGDPRDGRPPAGRLPGVRLTGWTTGRVLASAGLTLAGILAARAVLDRPARPRRLPRRPRGVAQARRQAGRRAMEGAAVLGASVLLDSAMEHFRGNYRNRAMYVAPAVASTTIAAAVGGRLRDPPWREREASRRIAFAVAAATGLVGLGFHLWNIGQRPGGFRAMNNWFYAAPVGAPGALMAAGLYGLASGAMGRAPTLSPRAEGRLLGAFTALNLLATTAEVGLLHFRGAFQNPAMYVPVALPPAAGLALLAASVDPEPGVLRLARAGCRATLATGAAGVGFHALGVHRNHGGWSNWRQTMIQGPPLFAPPAFVGLAQAGLGALDLIERSEA